MDMIDMWRYFGALLLVFGLIGMAAVAARKYGLGNIIQSKKPRRLQISESLALTPKQRLLLIRRDNVEHLIVVGPGGAHTIETNIPVFPDPTLPAEDAQ